MKSIFTSIAAIGILILVTTFHQAKGQSYLVGPVDPAVGASANYTAHNHYDLFNVMHPAGIYIDSLTIYPATAATSYTIVLQDSSQAQIASYTGISTVGSNLPERIKANIFVPMGTGYRLGLTTSSVGMLRNSSGIVFPYTVPNVVSITGSTFQTTYWYFFYNIRFTLPSSATDAGIFAITSPGDSLCSGIQPVSVTLKNYGPNSLANAKINWSVNNVAQPVYNWTGSLALNATTNVTVGTYNFLPGVTYDVKVYSSEPNTLADTVNANDTLVKTGIYVKTSPTASYTTSSTSVCQGDTVPITGTLTGTPPWNLVIHDGVTNIPIPNIQASPFGVAIVPATTTTYTLVSVSDATGCSSSPGTTLTITVLMAPPAVITPSTSPNLCMGDSVVMMASIGSGFTYEWFKDGVSIGGAVSYFYSTSQPGSYTVNIQGSNGCSNVSAPVVVSVNPLPVVSLGNDTVLLPGQSKPLNAGSGFSSYLWSTGATTQQILADTTGFGNGVRTFWVQVTDNNGCKGTDTIRINFTPNPGMVETNGEPWLSVFPNPTSGILTLSTTNVPSDLFRIELFGLDGRMVYRIENIMINKDEQYVMDVSHIANGVYLMKLSGGELTFSHRITVNR